MLIDDRWTAEDAKREREAFYTGHPFALVGFEFGRRTAVW
jgi:hypothetical protein